MMITSQLVPPKKATIPIFMTQFFFSFSFFGFYFILIIFLKHNLNFSDKSAYLLFGNFAALNYIAEFFGGLFGGRYLSFRAATILGLFMSSLGFLYLAVFHDVPNLIFGLTFIACGSGLLLPNLRNLLGILYQTSSSIDRDNAFTFLHIFNIGGQILGPSILSLLGLISSTWMFAGSGIGLVIGGIGMILNFNYLTYKPMELTKNISFRKTFHKAILCILALIFSIYYILDHRDIKYTLEIGLIALSIVLTVLIARMDKLSRTRVQAVCILFMGLLAADICFRQIFGIMNIFTDTYIDRQIGHFNVPSAVLLSMEPILLLIISPFVLYMRKNLERKKLYISPGTSASIGLFMLSIAFYILSSSTVLVENKISVIWLFSSFTVMATAELFLLPIIMSALSELSLPNWRGLMMGIFALSTSVASYLSGWLGQVISPVSGETSLSSYGTVFWELGLFALVSSICLLLLWKHWQYKHPEDLTDL